MHCCLLLQSFDSPLLSFAAAEWHASLQATRRSLLSSATVPAGEAVEYGIRSFVYTRRVGFSAQRFHTLLQEFALGSTKTFRGVMRVKGVFWVGEAHEAVGVWQATTPGTNNSITVRLTINTQIEDKHESMSLEEN
jgi:G3E family GTPase